MNVHHRSLSIRAAARPIAIAPTTKPHDAVACNASSMCFLIEQLPVQPQERTSHRFLGLFGALSMEAHKDDREIGKLPPVGAAPNRRQSHILGFWRVIGSGVMLPGETILPIFVGRGATKIKHNTV
jgi:hypothetical protein